MKITDKRKLQKMSFLDFNVKSTRIDSHAKSINFLLSGAWIRKGNHRIELEEGSLIFFGYEDVFISSYNAKEKSEQILSEKKYEELKEICEIDVHEEQIIIKGFAKNTFNWVEFHIKGGLVKGNFVEIGC